MSSTNRLLTAVFGCALALGTSVAFAQTGGTEDTGGRASGAGSQSVGGTGTGANGTANGRVRSATEPTSRGAAGAGETTGGATVPDSRR